LKANRITALAVPPTNWVPDPGAVEPRERFNSRSKRKPWDFDCEVSIPHYESLDTLPTVIALLRMQTVRPYIVIIDTGSSVETMMKLEQMRADDLEIHYLRFNGVKHISDFPAAACDLAFSIARNNVVVTMHTDVFLRKRTSLEELLRGLEISPAVGFQMTPRDRPEWETTVAHTFAAFWMPTMDAIGAGWALRRACNLTLGDATHDINGTWGNMLDTETCLSMVLRDNGIAPHFIGTEQNFEQTIHPLCRHVRTLTGSRIYCQREAKAAEARLIEAMAEARQNLKEWAL
jgi:hypothetical protein